MSPNDAILVLIADLQLRILKLQEELKEARAKLDSIAAGRMFDQKEKPHPKEPR